MVQRHQTPPQFDEATVVVHQSPPKNAKGNRRMELSWCQYAKMVGFAATDFIGRMLTPLL
jgi:hypothetical protein